MRVTWVNPSFSDYRVPVYVSLARMLSGNLRVIYSLDRTASRVADDLMADMGPRAIGLTGERSFSLGSVTNGFANTHLRIGFQQGLLTAISATKPDVIVSEGFFQWTPASLWCAIARRAALVIAYEGTSHTERRAGRVRRGYRSWMARRAQAIVCNGSLTQEYCTTTLGVSPHRIVTGAMAADNHWMANRITHHTHTDWPEELGHRVQLERPVYLYVGRLIRLKGLRELLAGWRIYSANREAPGTLLLVGEGPERSTVDRVVSAHALRNVVAVGAVPYSRIPAFYHASDVLVMPTLEDKWSLVVAEAMACGKPILCSVYNGCWPELVKPNVTGWTFHPENYHELASLFAKCADPTQDLARMGEMSRRVVAQFDVDHAASAVRHACTIALESRGRKS